MKQHQHTRVVNKAAERVNSMLDGIESGPTFMDRSPSSQTQAKRDRIAAAPESVRSLLDQGFDQEFVHRLAKLVEDRNG